MTVVSLQRYDVYTIGLDVHVSAYTRRRENAVEKPWNETNGWTCIARSTHGGNQKRTQQKRPHGRCIYIYIGGY